jgi:hypothetical protein
MKRSVLVLLLLSASSLLVAATASAASFSTYVGCSPDAEAAPSHVCQIGDEPGAFFESDSEVEYEVCVDFPNGEALCLEEPPVEPEVLFVNAITTELPGDHLVTWFVEGLEVGSWTFRMDAPPAPALPAPILPPPVVLSSASPRCIAAKGRVAKLKTRLRKAATRKQRVRIRLSLRRARARAKSACG